MMAKKVRKIMYKIKTLNKISEKINDVFDDKYEISADCEDEDAVIVRSFSMHDMELSKNLVAIGRAGAGVNNIPVDQCSEQGIVVFNAPGANANAVKEMTLASMIIASRNVLESIEWTEGLKGNGDQVPKMAEKGKGQFVGHEIKGMTIGVIGLGAIGAKVAESAINLGMNVLGTDPHLSVGTALSLSNKVQVVSEDEVIRNSDVITIHAPLTDETRETYDEEFIAKTKDGVILLNFSRAEIAKASAIKDALASGKVKKYIVDFPTDELLGVPGVITMPHLASGTYEAEDNCAVMAAEQIKDYIENGNIKNSVNFPACDAGICEQEQRICVCHRNVKGVIHSVTSIVSDEGINIWNMVNKSRGDYAYTMLDLSSRLAEDKIQTIRELEGVLSVRAIG